MPTPRFCRPLMYSAQLQLLGNQNRYCDMYIECTQNYISTYVHVSTLIHTYTSGVDACAKVLQATDAQRTSAAAGKSKQVKRTMYPRVPVYVHKLACNIVSVPTLLYRSGPSGYLFVDVDFLWYVSCVWISDTAAARACSA